jgi:hypothetical protein
MSIAKPISEMTDDEVLAYIDELRATRTKRREDMIAARSVPKPKADGGTAKPAVKRVTKGDLDEITAGILRTLLASEGDK